MIRYSTVYRRIHGYFFTHLCTPRRRPRRSHSRRRRDVTARRGHARDVSVVVDARVRVYVVVVDDGVVVQVFQGATRRRACATPRARLDAGVGAFGSKAGMTQVFTEDGLCVPVTVIAVREGNVVTQVRIRGNFLCVCARARAVASVSLDPTADSSIHSFIHSSRVGWVTRRDATSVGETATVMDVERGEGRRGRRWRENAPFRSFVRSFVRSRDACAVDANARVDASRRACRPRVSFRDARAGERGKATDGWMDR